MIEGEKDARAPHDVKEEARRWPFRDMSAQYQRHLIQKALLVCDWDTERTSRVLEMPHTSLIAMMNKLAIKKPETPATVTETVLGETPSQAKGDGVVKTSDGRTISTDGARRMREGARRGGLARAMKMKMSPEARARYEAGVRKGGKARWEKAKAKAAVAGPVIKTKPKVRRTPVSKSTLKRIGRAVRIRREEKGWLTKDLAERAGISPSGISNLEHAAYVPSLTVLEKVAGALGCQVSELGTARFMGRMKSTRVGQAHPRTAKMNGVPESGAIGALSRRMEELLTDLARIDEVSGRIERIEAALDQVLGTDWRE